MYEKETNGEAPLEPSQEFFAKKSLALNHFLKKSFIIDVWHVLNPPLSYYDTICYFKTDDNTALPSSESM